MEEREIERILRPKKRLVILFSIYLIIAFVCIGFVFFMRFADKEKDVLNLSETVLNHTEGEGQYVKLDIDTLPIIMIPVSQEDNRFYFVRDFDNHIYIARLSNETYKKITETLDMKTGKLNSSYQLKGKLIHIDEEMMKFAISNTDRVFSDEKISVDNFSEQIGSFYIEESIVTERMVTLYTILVLFGVFLLIVDLGYILPGILKVRRIFDYEELVEELRTELGNLTDTPYKKQRIYLTRNYIISGIQAIKYEDVIWGYILSQSSYGIKVGENLIVHTKDKKKHIIGSVAGANNDVLNSVLSDISSRNIDMRVGYTKENKEFFENNKES